MAMIDDVDEEIQKAAILAAYGRGWKDGYGQGRDDEADGLPLVRDRSAHHVWLDARRRRICTCPLADDHNPSAWRSPQALAEVGLTVGPGRLTAWTLCQSCGAFEHAHGRCPYY